MNLSVKSRRVGNVTNLEVTTRSTVAYRLSFTGSSLQHFKWGPRSKLLSTINITSNLSVGMVCINSRPGSPPQLQGIRTSGPTSHQHEVTTRYEYEPHVIARCGRLLVDISKIRIGETRCAIFRAS